MDRRVTQKKLGIVGGLGPLASAEFVKTIYQYSLGQREQEAPIVILKSDPTIPDRTTELLNGSHTFLLAHLIEDLQCLVAMDIGNIVICCVTMHYLLPFLPKELREKVISLVENIIVEISDSGKKQLLLCTTGTRELGIFQNHAQWNLVENLIIWPEESDQKKIHSLIYQIKRNENLDAVISMLEIFLVKYNVTSFIAGCTEFHLLTRHPVFAHGNPHGYTCIDPLITTAKNLARGDV